MNHLVSTLLLGGIFSWSSSLPACQNGTLEQFEAAKSFALAAPAAESSEEEGYLKIRIPQGESSIVFNYFTLEGHPAHPSNVVSAIYEAEGQVWLYSRGFTAGPCAEFEAWMDGFRDQHEIVQQAVQKALNEGKKQQ